MSGGSLDYISGRVEDAANTIMQLSKSELHRAFAKHVLLVASALHDLEWILSGDRSSPSEEESIRKVIGPQMILQSVIDDAVEIKKNLDLAIIQARKEKLYLYGKP